MDIRKATYLFALIIVALLASTVGNATEREEFPEGHDELKQSFGSYMSLSERTLNEFDELTGNRISQGDSYWSSTSKRVIGELKSARTHAERQAKDDELPEEVVDWYLEELTAWESVESIGSDIIVLHNAILKTTTKVDSSTETLVHKAGRAKALAEPISKFLEPFTGSLLPEKGFPELEDMYTSVIRDAAVQLDRVLFSVNDVALKLQDHINSENYPARVRTLNNKHIDPDQKGVFLRHEERWERNLSAALDRFDQAYIRFNRQLSAIRQGEINDWLSYFQGGHSRIVERLNRELERLRVNYRIMISRLGDPEAKIVSVRLRDFREPGDRQTALVKIKNTGKLTLLPGEWTLDCYIVKRPTKYRLKTGDFKACYEPVPISDELRPNKTETMEFKLQAPERSGRWGLKWRLTHNDSEKDTFRKEFSIFGKVEVKFNWIKVDNKKVSKSRRTDLEVGRRYDIDVQIENRGTDILFRNRYRLMAVVDRGKKWPDMKFSLPLKKDVHPRDDYKFSHTIEGAREAGVRDIEFKLVASGKTVASEERTFNVK